MSLVINSEMIKTTPSSGSISLAYDLDTDKFVILDSDNNFRPINSHQYVLTNSDSTNYKLLSGSNTTNNKTTYKFFTLSGSGATSVVLAESQINISNSSTGKTNVIYSGTNVGTGIAIYSGSITSNNTTVFNFNTITGTNCAISVDNNSIIIAAQTKSIIYSNEYNNVSITESFLQPNAWLLANAVFNLPSGTLGSLAWPISGVIYLFNSYTASIVNSTNKILYASMSNLSSSNSWLSVTNVMPRTKQQAIIGNKIYQFGGYTSFFGASATIMTASVNNPLVWGDSSASLPIPIEAGSLYVSKETGKIIIYGGATTAGSYLNSIYTASISNPLSWGQDTAILPSRNCGQTLVEAGEWIYLYGGGVDYTVSAVANSSSVIWKAHKSTPTIVTNTSCSISSGGLRFGSQPVQIGNYVYIDDFRLNVDEPCILERIMSSGVSGSSIFISKNKIFRLGGTTANNMDIVTSSNALSCSTTLMSSSRYQPAPAIEISSKIPTLYSSIEKYGSSAIWQTDDVNR